MILIVVDISRFLDRHDFTISFYADKLSKYRGKNYI
jgi:hypothetical protein